MIEEVKTMTKDDIELYLNGHNPLENVVCIESDWGSEKVSLIIDEPNKGKRIETHTFEAFSFIKDLKKAKNPFYRNNKEELARAVKYNGITSRKLETRGIERIEDGYKFLIKSSKSPRHLDNFFKGGDLKFFSKEFDDESTYDKGFAVTPANAEQFMIQSGVRLFKGVDKYSDVHKFYFDIETTSLLPQTGHIFMIGMCTNRGFRKVLAIDYNDPDSERNMIIEFFNTIHTISPTIILGYNSESFDFTFILGRAEELGIDFGTMIDGSFHYDVRTSLDPLKPIKRQPKTLKFGSETERYQQTSMWGYNVIDIAHAVRAAKAINSEIKSWSLKYVTQFIKANKPTRTYVDGDKIYKIWKENKYYFHNIKNYKYELIPDKYQSEEGSKEYLKKIKAWILQEKSGKNTNESIKKLSEFLDNDENNVEIIMGNQIIFNYLIDDLEETMAVDENFCTPNFLLSKNLPTTYVRTSTMGTAVKWKLLLTGFAYLNNFAIPANDKKKDIVGGLSRLLYCGYAKDVLKLDYNSLYPSIQLTHDVFPDIDIYGFLKLSLSHFRDKRNYFKGLSKKHQKLFEKNGDNLDRILAKQFDTVQLPVKILNNGEFGAVSAPHIFNWGGNHDGETVTCYGRQYLRLMIWFFNQRGFKPLVGDSVTWNTPIYIRYDNGMIDIIPVEETFNDKVSINGETGDRDYSEKNYEVLTVNGWKKLKYSYRHGTDKAIHKVETKDRVVNVTSDHSLFQNGIQIKPNELKRGDKIDVYNINNFNSVSDISLEKAWLYGFFLGDGSANNSPRKSNYISRKTGIKSSGKGGKRSDWKISNNRIDFLYKLQDILKKDFNIDSRIKDHRESSNVYNLVVTNVEFCDSFCKDFYTTKRYKKVPSFILNSSSDIKKAFLNGVCASGGYGDTIEECVSIGMKSEIAMAGIALICKELGIEYRLKTRLDKQNFNTILFKHKRGKDSKITEFSNRSDKETDKVWKNEVITNDDPNNYVYDISTEDGTFIGGIGLINLKNTDGFNFSMPDNHKDLRYTNKEGKEFESFHAVIAEFNDLYMTGVMGLSLDGLYSATINLARKNYIDLNDDGSIKLVGNSLKSSTLCKFFDDVIQKTARLLVEDKPKEFIELYYNSLEKIYNMEVPLIEIATKSKVKETLEDYLYDQKHKVNKNGDKVSRKAHMELLVKANLQPDMGSYVYFINIGKAKSHNDIEHLELLDERDFISDPNKTGYYNVPQAIDKFNEKMKMFLVCFKDVVRESLIVKNPKDRAFYTDSDIELQTGKPLETDKQDALDHSEYIDGMSNEPLMEMSEKEVMFWNRSERNPNDVFPHFTTLISREPLLSQDEKVEVRRKGNKIIEFFKNNGVSVKMEYEYARDHEITLRYSKLYKTTIEVTNKRGRVSEEIIHQELNEISWILSKYDEKRKTRMDFQVIDYSLIED